MTAIIADFLCKQAYINKQTALKNREYLSLKQMAGLSIPVEDTLFL